jgi:PAS domain S-box-containing protein
MKEVDEKDILQSDMTDGLNLLRVIDVIPDMVVIIDLAGNITYANPAHCGVLGYEPSELFGKCAFDLVHPDDIRDVAREFAAALETGRSGKAAYRDIRKDGSVCPVESSGVLLKSTGDAPTHILIITRDMTEHVRNNEKLMAMNEAMSAGLEETKKLKELAEAADRAKSDFLANMSHEFVTPLNSVIGFTQTLLDGIAGPISEKQREYLDRVLKGGETLVRISRDMVELASLDLSTSVLERSRVRVCDLLITAAEEARGPASMRNIRVEHCMDAQSDFCISADSTRLMTALRQLLSNAVKFTADGGSVIISMKMVSRETGELHGALEITVTDTGIGIKREDLPGLFQTIGQLASPYNKKSPGTGVGLLLVKKIISLHGGTVRAESEFGKGSSFIVTLPVDEDVQERERE